MLINNNYSIYTALYKPPGSPAIDLFWIWVYLYPQERRQRIDIRLPPPLIEWLKSQGGITETIERLVRQAIEKDPAE